MLIIGLLRLIWALFVISVPLAGIWIASSMAALSNSPIWVACLIGALAFPIIPIAWEVLGELLRRRAKARGPKRLSDLRSVGTGFMSGDDRALTLFDRLILRTLAVNLLFVGGLVWSSPETIYSALSARGDWMLEGVDAPWADAVRAKLHETAERFEWLHERTHENKYEELVDSEYTAPPPPPPPPSELPSFADPSPSSRPEQPAQPDPGDPQPTAAEPEDEPEAAPSKPWPQVATVHPVVQNMPEEAERSIASVAAFIVAHETEPFARVKALHDYVATRVAYDTHAAEVGPIPPQDAQTTFDTRLSVCAGYANLLAALVEAAGGKAVVIPGYARGLGGELSGEGHAWNAVEIEGQWYLVDSTWNAGASQDGKWGFGYSTDYLFVPPEVIGLTHFPEDPGWQLRAQPLTRGEFLRQPVLRPGFFAEGFSLISPTRSQISAEDHVELVIGNANARHVLAKIRPKQGGAEQNCSVERDMARWRLEVYCQLPGPGSYDLELYSNSEAYGQFGFIGSLSVNAG